MEDPKENQETGKRVGIHPLIVLFGVIFGLWIFTQAIIPKSKNIQPPQGPGTKAVESQFIGEANSALFLGFLLDLPIVLSVGFNSWKDKQNNLKKIYKNSRTRNGIPCGNKLRVTGTVS